MTICECCKPSGPKGDYPYHGVVLQGYTPWFCPLDHWTYIAKELYCAETCAEAAS